MAILKPFDQWDIELDLFDVLTLDPSKWNDTAREDHKHIAKWMRAPWDIYAFEEFGRDVLVATIAQREKTWADKFDTRGNKHAQYARAMHTWRHDARVKVKPHLEGAETEDVLYDTADMVYKDRKMLAALEDASHKVLGRHAFILSVIPRRFHGDANVQALVATLMKDVTDIVGVQWASGIAQGPHPHVGDLPFADNRNTIARVAMTRELLAMARLVSKRFPSNFTLWINYMGTNQALAMQVIANYAHTPNVAMVKLDPMFGEAHALGYREHKNRVARYNAERARTARLANLDAVFMMPELAACIEPAKRRNTKKAVKTDGRRSRTHKRRGVATVTEAEVAHEDDKTGPKHAAVVQGKDRVAQVKRQTILKAAMFRAARFGLFSDCEVTDSLLNGGDAHNFMRHTALALGDPAAHGDIRKYLAVRTPYVPRTEDLHDIQERFPILPVYAKDPDHPGHGVPFPVVDPTGGDWYPHEAPVPVNVITLPSMDEPQPSVPSRSPNTPNPLDSAYISGDQSLASASRPPSRAGDDDHPEIESLDGTELSGYAYDDVGADELLSSFPLST